MDSRIAVTNEYRRLCDELEESGYRSISARSYLWVVGWCNTGGAYRRSSREYVQPLALTLFGYVPENFLPVEGQRVNLKDHRYSSQLRGTLRASILANHRDKLMD